MTRIPGTFRRLGKAGEAALIPYLAAGVPSLDVTRRILPVIGRQGADLIVIGPTPGIMQATGTEGPVRAASLDDCLSIAAEARRSNEVPLVLLAYRSDVHERGAADLAAECAAAGIDALLVADLPADEAPPLGVDCRAAGIDLVFPVSSSGDAWALDAAGGFVFCTDNDTVGLASLVEQVRQHTDLPVVGPIANATTDDVAELSHLADGVLVVGSLLRVMEGGEEEEVMLDVSEVVRTLKAATHRAAPTR